VVVATLGNKVCDFVARNSTQLNSMQLFQLLHQLCEGGYTCNFCRVLATPQFSTKLYHHQKQKIAPVAMASVSP